MEASIARFATKKQTMHLDHSRQSIPRADGYRSARARSAEKV
jgi:hypothetical protein